MPLKLADLKKSTKAVTFEFLGESVTVVYRHRVLTPVLRLQLVGGWTMFDDGDTAALTVGRAVEINREYLAALAGLLVEWDVIGDDGRPLTPSAELLEQFDEEFVRALVAALVRGEQVDPPSGEDSPATSPPTG